MKYSELFRNCQIIVSLAEEELKPLLKNNESSSDTLEPVLRKIYYVLGKCLTYNAKKAKVLLIEPPGHQLEIMIMCIRDAGYSVHWEPTLKRAKFYIGNQLPDVIIVNSLYKKKNGYFETADFVEALRLSCPEKKLAVVLTSINPGDFKTAQKLKAQFIYTKNIDPRYFNEAIKLALLS